jgi:zinc protease
VVVGQFETEPVQKLATELFGNWKSPAPFQRVLSSYRKIDPIQRTIETPDKQNATLIAGELVKISDEDADYPAMIMANYMLGRMPLSNRLFRRIRDKEGLSYSVNSSLSIPTKNDGGSFIARAISAPGNTPKAEASLIDELNRTAKEGFGAEELSAAKSAWAQERLVQRSDDSALASVLAAREFFDRTMKFDEQLEAKVAAVTAEQVSAAFRRLIDPASLTIVRAGDFKKAEVYQK